VFWQLPGLLASFSGHKNLLRFQVYKNHDF